MSKKYIKSSNEAPKALLMFPWLLALTTDVLRWPTWVYGVAGTIAVIFIITFIVRIVTEEGVDVVDREKQ